MDARHPDTLLSARELAAKVAPTLIELAGFAAVVYGLWLIYQPAAYVTGGVLALTPSVIRNWPRSTSESA